jgi:DNA repair exonuclease SbcCD ATPase subunit
MLDAIKPLLENGLIDKEVGQHINEAWESKLNEAREQVRAELREEFARKYEHDKNVMVEALDRMVTESLRAEIGEFREERKAMNEDRVRAQSQLRENAKKFNNFMVKKLAEEIRELRDDRKSQMENRQKLEQFTVNALAREIKEFHQDKQAVVEAKVKLVAEAKTQLQALKQKFIKESAVKINRAVTQHLQGEISQLKEDIQAARESQFGRRLFEAFAAEFRTTHLNENAEVRKLMKQIAKKEKQLAESAKQITTAKKLVESKEREVRIIKDSNLREKTMTELLGTLNEEKSEVMRNLLESVQTPKLKSAFDKYLPAVLNSGKSKSVATEKKQMIAESVVTGDKTAKKTEVDAEERDNVIAIKRLAGL